MSDTESTAAQVTHELDRLVVGEDFELSDIDDDLNDPHSIIMQQNEIHQSLQVNGNICQKTP